MQMTIWRFLGLERCTQIPDLISLIEREEAVWKSKDKRIGREKIPLVMLTLLSVILNPILIREIPSMPRFSRKYRKLQLKARHMLN